MADINVSETLKTILDERGWTVYKLAKESGLSESTVYNTCSGKSIPRIDVLEKLCRGLGMTLVQFCEKSQDGTEIEYFTRREIRIIELLRKVVPWQVELVETYINGIIDSNPKR